MGTLGPAILSFIERLSSLQRLNCMSIIERGPQCVSFLGFSVCPLHIRGSTVLMQTHNSQAFIILSLSLTHTGDLQYQSAAVWEGPAVGCQWGVWERAAWGRVSQAGGGSPHVCCSPGREERSPGPGLYLLLQPPDGEWGRERGYYNGYNYVSQHILTMGLTHTESIEAQCCYVLQWSMKCILILTSAGLLTQVYGDWRVGGGGGGGGK